MNSENLLFYTIRIKGKDLILLRTDITLLSCTGTTYIILQKIYIFSTKLLYIFGILTQGKCLFANPIWITTTLQL